MGENPHFLNLIFLIFLNALSWKDFSTLYSPWLYFMPAVQIVSLEIFKSQNNIQIT